MKITPEMQEAYRASMEAEQKKQMNEMKKAQIRAVGVGVHASILGPLLARCDETIMTEDDVDAVRRRAADEAVQVMRAWGFDVGTGTQEEAQQSEDPS